MIAARLMLTVELHTQSALAMLDGTLRMPLERGESSCCN